MSKSSKFSAFDFEAELADQAGGPEIILEALRLAANYDIRMNSLLEAGGRYLDEARDARKWIKALEASNSVLGVALAEKQELISGLMAETAALQAEHQEIMNPKPTHRHYKGGLYRMVAAGLLESDPRVRMVAYVGENGETWFRTAENFDEVMPDGTPRFYALALDNLPRYHHPDDEK